MRALIFLAGYVCIAALGVHSLSAGDPEPLGASASLFLLGVVGAVLAPSVFFGSAKLGICSPSKLRAFIAGALCAFVFFATLTLVHFGIGQLFSFVAAVVALVIVAAVSSRVAFEA